MERSERTLLWRHHAVILLVAGLVFFTNLGSAALFDEDEPKNAVCGREMFLRGDWIVPTFNQELRTDKPILIYWLMLCSYTVFGVNEFAARFGSSALAVVTSVFVYHLGRRLFHPDVGLWGAVILCTCLMFAAVGRAATPDSMLICGVTGTFLAYVLAVPQPGFSESRAARSSDCVAGSESSMAPSWPSTPEPQSKDRDARLSEKPGVGVPWRNYVPTTWVATLPMAFMMGLAVLAKGPVGLVLPTGILGMFLLIRQQLDARATQPQYATTVWWRRWLTEVFCTLHPLRIWRASWALRLPLVFTVVAVVALPWYLTVGYATGGDWLAGFLGGHNVGRFLQPMENHSGPIVYYLPVLALGTFPWSVFLPLAVWHAGRELRKQAAQSASLLFLACWAGVWIAFFSCASTKLPNYVLPAYPPLALLTAWYLHRWQHAPAFDGGVAFRHSCRVLAGVGVAFLIAVPVALSILLPSEMWLALIGIAPLTGAAVAYGRSLRHERPQALRALGVAAVALAVLIVGIAPTRVASHQDGPQFGRLIRELVPNGDDVRLATFDYFSPNLVFYAAQRVERLKRPPQIEEFFDQHPQGLLLTRADRWDELEPQLGSEITVVGRQPRFLRRHDLVLLSRTPQTVQPASHATTR
jgi:4-amino-4-deoxy-L-arabinose transferase-like glycosyltransferase